MSVSDLDALNQREFRKLVLSVKANTQQLELLLAICDDRNLQDTLISAYEAELKAEGITPLRARLNLKQPSLRATLEALVAQEPILQSGDPAVVTVLNAGELLGVRLTAEKSEQERFFFSLQWTREALRQFHFPIVLWLPDGIATRLAQQAPDFWSWRTGVFEFVAAGRAVAGLPEMMPLMPEREPVDESAQVPLVDLLAQVAELEQSTPESPLLVTLYNEVGQAYERRYEYQQALEFYEKGLALAEAKKDLAGQARSAFNLGDSLRYCGRSFQAVEFHEKALEIFREIGDRQGEAKSLVGLGNSYNLLGQYQQAIDFQQQSLEIRREISDRKGEANSLMNLGNAYFSLGQYQQAIDFQQQSLEINREIGDRNGEASSLGNLGNAYYSLGQYQRAIDFQQQSLEIFREIGDRNGEANALGNLGNAYYSLGQHQRAIDFQQQSLEIRHEIGDRNGEAASLGNLGSAYYSLGQYQRAIDFQQQSLEIRHEIGDRNGEAASWFNKGHALARIDQKWEAQSSYEKARALYKELGLRKRVEQCDRAIRELGQKVVVVPKQAPAIGGEPAKPRNRRRVPIVVWFVIGLGLVLLIWWLFQ